MNATLITFNGNEQMLQNDMGNTRIQDSKTGNIMSLREGFVPVGLKEHGGVIYIASVNKEGVGEIGTIPSPVIKFNQESPEEILENQKIEFSSGSNNSELIPITSLILYPEEKFVVSLKLEEDLNNLLSVNSTLNDIPTAVNFISGSDVKRYYKVNLYSKTEHGIIDLTNHIQNFYSTYIISNDLFISKYWFLDNVSLSNLNIDEMIRLDGSISNNSVDKTKCFVHYPCVEPGVPYIGLEKENISKISLLKNYTNSSNGQIYPVLNYNDKDGYIVSVFGFEYETESLVDVDKVIITISCYGMKPKQVSFTNVQNKSNNQGIESVLKYFSKAGYTEDPHLVSDINSDVSEDAIISYALGEDCNKWINISVDYYSEKWTDKLGSYKYKYNPYYMDVLKVNIIDSLWQPHLFGNNSEFNQYRDVNSSDTYLQLHSDTPLNTAIKSYSTGIIKIDNCRIGKRDLATANGDYREFVPIEYIPEDKKIIKFTIDPKQTPENISLGYSSYLKLKAEDITNENGNDFSLSFLNLYFKMRTTSHNIRYDANNYYKNIIRFSGLRITLGELKIGEYLVSSFSVDGANTEGSDIILTIRDIIKNVGNDKYAIVINTALYILFPNNNDNLLINNYINDCIKNKSLIECSIKIKNIESYQIKYVFPWNMYDRLPFTQFEIEPKLEISTSISTKDFKILNQSECLVTPQFDLFVTTNEGGVETIYPGYYNPNNTEQLKKSRIIIDKNYLSFKTNLSEEIYNESTFDLKGYNVPKILNDCILYNDTLPSNKLFLIITAEPNASMQINYDNVSLSDYSSYLIYPTNNNKIEIIYSKESAVAVGIYEIDINNLDISTIINRKIVPFNNGDYEIYLQSIICYKEDNTVDKWARQTKEYFPKTYNYNPIPAEGYQTIYKSISSGKYIENDSNINLQFRIVPNRVYTGALSDLTNDPNIPDIIIKDDTTIVV